ncbi:aluminum-activated malate transporter 10-like [Magnolia sinica]|uniref:aluminum-activated malate transporter 10-like n=1 Tax=Magnolia sinica TaxID=86752 RepID=UPI0026591728|nr:aluminum-activated malate transporter 10-like [Magnolia sinica]
MAGILEWRLTVSDGSSQELTPELRWTYRAWTSVVRLIVGLRLRILKFMEKIWKLAVDDPRRVAHCLKVATALTVVSLFYYVRPLYDGVGGTAMWAVMTVVVVFEYTVGATLSKGLNRGIATLLAGALAIGVHELAHRSGDKAEPIILGASLFLFASAATFSRFIPTVKTRFDYGVSIFILTFSLVTVSGYRVNQLVELAHQRLSTIAIGGALCMVISMLVCPVWAGNDLHLLIARNMEKLAMSLDGCVEQYFNDNGNASDDEEACQELNGYKCVLNSKAAEESLANFARWEPAHGHFGFWHPWKQYLKIGTALRFCAYCVEALNCSINPDIKAPEFIKKHLCGPCMRLSLHSSNVLKELSITTRTMRKSSTIDFSIGEMNGAVEDLQNALRSLPHQLPPPPTSSTEEHEVDKNRHNSVPPIVSIMEVMPLITAASLLIEIAARIESVVDAVEKLAGLASFKQAVDDKPDKPKRIEAHNKPTLEEQGQEGMKALEVA